MEYVKDAVVGGVQLSYDLVEWVMETDEWNRLGTFDTWNQANAERELYYAEMLEEAQRRDEDINDILYVITKVV